MAAGVLCLAVAAGLALYDYHYDHRSGPAPPPASGLTPQQFQAAVGKASDLMRTAGIQQSFDYIAGRAAHEPAFAKDCHPVLHAFGHQAYAYFGSFSQAMRYQNELCDSGYTHGVLEAFFMQAPDTETALTAACPAAGQAAFQQWQCYHGVGHGLMMAGGDNTDDALRLCRTLAPPLASVACANGVFMQHFTVIDHSGRRVAGASVTSSECARYAAGLRADCYYYAPSAYIALHGGDYVAAGRWCGQVETRYRANCAEGVGGQAMKDNMLDPAAVRRACDRLDSGYRAACIQGAAGMYSFSKASSRAAEALCGGDFRAYRAACETEAASVRQSMAI